ncbi:MAG: lactonase family protein [Pirellulales bacterium]
MMARVRMSGVGGVWLAGFLLACIAAAAPAAEPKQASAGKMPVYVGTYTNSTSKGIYLYHLDLATGELAPGGLVAEMANPTFLAVHPSRPLLYAVNEIGNFKGKRAGGVAAMAIDPKTGKLTLLNQQSSVGDGPCHLAIDRSGKQVVVANYGGGSVAVLPIREDGRLGEATSFVQHAGSSVNPRRQEGPHAHCATFDAAGRFVFVPDLGLDKVMTYRLDAAGKLTAGDPAFTAIAAGSGPRHVAFHPDGRHAYVINELNSTMTALSYDAQRGVLKPLQTLSTLPAGFTKTSTCAEVVVHPSGRFVYGSNRGHDSIVIYAVDLKTGLLSLVGHEPTQGKTPRNFALDPAGKFLLAANQDGNNIVVFRIDVATGKLRATGHAVSLGMPVCVVMIPESPSPAR